MRLRLLGLAFLVPALAILGCGEKTPPPPAKDSGKTTDSKKDDSGSKASSSGSKVPTGAVENKGSGTLEGVVLFDGDPPKSGEVKMEKDTDYCKMGDTTEQTWKVGGANKGVANVVVWLRAPDGKYFKIPDKYKERKEPVVIGQPYCAFEPHVSVLNPTYYDADSKKQKPTGQILRVINDATIPHNSNVSFKKPFNNGASPQLPAKKGDEVSKAEFKDVLPCKEKEAGGEEEAKISCNIHPWMTAYVKVFDHPFAAVTSGAKKDDKEFGAFKIEDAPAGVPLDVYYWHESMNAAKKHDKQVTIEDGKPTKIEIKLAAK